MQILKISLLITLCIINASIYNMVHEQAKIDATQVEIIIDKQKLNNVFIENVTIGDAKMVKLLIAFVDLNTDFNGSTLLDHALKISDSKSADDNFHFKDEKENYKKIAIILNNAKLGIIKSNL